MKKILKILGLSLILLAGSCAKAQSKVNINSYKDKECSRCEGKGKIRCDYCLKANFTNSCPLCNKTYLRKCPNCEGTGKIPSDSSDDDK